jgi:hypothetical protein
MKRDAIRWVNLVLTLSRWLVKALGALPAQRDTPAVKSCRSLDCPAMVSFPPVLSTHAKRCSAAVCPAGF